MLVRNPFSSLMRRIHSDRVGDVFAHADGKTLTRASFVPQLQNISSAIEIGPFFRPILEQNTAKFFDVLTTEELRQRATDLGKDPSKVPEIHYVSRDADLSIIDETFELVASSHSIEHQPDLIEHLRRVQAVLSPGGVYALIIPDCRYCFDHFLPPSHIGDVIEASLERRTRHKLSSVIEHRALVTHNDPRRHWKGDHGIPISNLRFILDAIREWKESNGGYLDVHAWQFTPDSFRALIDALYELEFIGLKTCRVYQTPYGSNEFCAVIEKLERQ